MTDTGGSTGFGWQFFADARTFLDVAGGRIGDDPLGHSMVGAWSAREVTRRDTGAWTDPEQPYWYAAHLKGGECDAVAMRTHPGPGHPLWVGPMDSEAATALGRLVVSRGEGLGAFGVNGMLPAAREVADAVAERTGRSVVEAVRTRLFRLEALTWPRRPAGDLRRATTEDLDLVVDWLDRFAADAAAQAGRTSSHEGGVLSPAEVRRRILDGNFLVWTTPEGEVVHLTGAAAVNLGVAGVGPVYTPAEHRGNGYAGWVVAARSQEVLDARAVPYLFTDQANPVSNRLYESLGYRAVCDTAELTLR